MRDPTLVGHPLAVGGQPDKQGVGLPATTKRERFQSFGHGDVAGGPAMSRPHDCAASHELLSRHLKADSGDFQRYTDVIEPLSLDEAFLDVGLRAMSRQRDTDR